MARRRLSPVDPAALGTTFAGAGPDVSRAEHFLETKAFARLSPSPPIARVAADAAGTAAFEELSEALARARDEGRMVVDLPLDAIAPDHLARDRIPVEDEEMAALRESIRLHGQRSPVEVTPLVTTGAEAGPETGPGALPYGLISGWRRLAALKALHAETGDPRFATVQVLIRRPETAAAAYTAMVEENEIRVGLSYYERARVAALATRRGVFDSEKKALLALFPTASRPKRSRIRAFLEIVHALDGRLRFPQALPERLGLKLVAMMREGGGARVAHALDRADPKTAEEELRALAELVASPHDMHPRGPKLAEEILPGVALEARLRGRTLVLKLKGEGVTPALRDQIHGLLMGLSK